MPQLIEKNSAVDVVQLSVCTPIQCERAVLTNRRRRVVRRFAAQ